MTSSKAMEKDKAMANPTVCPDLKITRSTAAEKGKALANPTICPDMQLDPDLWKSLPSDLMDVVLTKTPFPSLMKFRGVCKHWKSVAVPKAARVGKVRGTTVLLCQPRYDPLHTRWPYKCLWLPCGRELIAQPLQTIEPEPSQAFDPERLLQGLFPGHVYRRLVSSEGGLLFLASREVNKKGGCMLWKRVILVWNPVTQERKVLDIPSTLLDNKEYLVGPPNVGAVVYAETGNYKLVVAADLDMCSPADYTTLLYDSSSHLWKRTECIPQSQVGLPVVRSRRPFLQRGVCYKDDIYFALTSFLDTISLDTSTSDEADEDEFELNEVLKFDVHKETWTKMGKINISVDFHQLSLNRENGKTRLLTQFTRYRPGQLVSARRELAHAMSKRKVQCIDFDPDSLTDCKLRKTMHKFFLDHNPKVRAMDHTLEYAGFRQENKFYHVLYLGDTHNKYDEQAVSDADSDADHDTLVSDVDDDYDDEQLDVRAVFHESGEHLDTRLYIKDRFALHDVGVVVHELGKHSDIPLYLRKCLRKGISYDFYAFSPSLDVSV